MIRDEESARAYVGAQCDASAIGRVERLVEMLREENERQNLVARGTLDSVWQRHIADSAQLLRFVAGEPGIWLDLGTGAGFPGLVVAAMRPNWPMRLVESRRMRVEWLQRCCRELDLERCEVLGERLERIESFPAAVISARAFAPLSSLLDLSSRFSTPSTLWLLPKGRKAELELAGVPAKQRIVFHVEQSLTDREAGIIVGGPSRVTEPA